MFDLCLIYLIFISFYLSSFDFLIKKGFDSNVLNDLGI